MADEERLRLAQSAKDAGIKFAPDGRPDLDRVHTLHALHRIMRGGLPDLPPPPDALVERRGDPLTEEDLSFAMLNEKRMPQRVSQWQDQQNGVMSELRQAMLKRSQGKK